jgi:hypothetical protein
MSDYQPAPQGKDPELWELAQKRVGFRSHALTYVIVNAFLWAIWFFSSSNPVDFDGGNIRWGHYPWPIWPTLGWGVGLAFHFAGVYIFPKTNSVEREYERLKNQQKNK